MSTKQSALLVELIMQKMTAGRMRRLIALALVLVKLHDELELMVAAGVTPLAALQSATTEQARAFGLTDALGEIGPGQAADLVLLDGDPLVNIGNTRRIFSVVLNGDWLERSAGACDRRRHRRRDPLG